MKKILSVILLCALVLSVFTACSGENTPAAVKAFDKEVSSEKPTNKTVAKAAKAGALRRPKATRCGLINGATRLQDTRE